ncbi:MAG: DUF4412 domain-containing protein [Deltaproteobacteria bacterium]|nr:DUF4412 domain-containing protein [bacterium]MCB9487201.1 DUF4412 domain-containing protein [Deltaproteobacteria bacterium]
MKTRFFLALFASAITASALFAISTQAASAEEKDYTIEEKMVTVAPDNQPTQSGTVKTYVSGNKMRKDSLGSESMIYRADKDVVWIVRREQREYLEIPYAQIRAMTEQSLQVYAPPTPGNEEVPKNLYEKTGERQTIGYWPCEVIRLNTRQILGPGVTSRTTMCVSTATGLEAEDLVRTLRISLGNRISTRVNELLDRILKLEGYPVETKTVTDVQGKTAQTTMTLQSVKVAPIDGSVFEIPEGFKLIQAPTTR